MGLIIGLGRNKGGALVKPIIVETLPTASESTMNQVYLVPSASDTDMFDVYYTVESGGSYSWEQDGSVSREGFEIADNLTTNDATKALSAKQGKVLGGEVAALGQKVTNLENGVPTYSWTDTPSANSAIKELYLEGLKPNKYYYFRYLCKGDGTNELIYIRECDDASGTNPILVVRCVDDTPTNGILRLEPYNNSGISGYIIKNITSPTAWATIEAYINKAVASNIDYSPRIKEYIDFGSINTDISDLGDSITSLSNKIDGVEEITLKELSHGNNPFTMESGKVYYFRNHSGTFVNIYARVSADSANIAIRTSVPNGTEFYYRATTDTGIIRAIGVASFTDGLDVIELTSLTEKIRGAETLMQYFNMPENVGDAIELAYITDEYTSESDALNLINSYINNGEYGMCIPYFLAYKESGNTTIATIDGVTMSGFDVLKTKTYKFLGYSGTLKKLKYGTLPSRYPLIFDMKKATPTGAIQWQVDEQDNQFTLHDIADWPFATPDSNGIYHQLDLCYAYMDRLVHDHPSRIVKYDPMAAEEYTDALGNGVYPIDLIRNRMSSRHGFSDYPIYMQGITTEGDYTIGNYTAHLLPTPAYKTFIYRIHDDRMGADGLTRLPRRAIYIQAGIHAAEVMSQICSCLFAGGLFEVGNANSEFIKANYDIWIVPCLEGYGGMHGVSLNALGVNPNRNYATPFWKYNDSEKTGLAAGDQFSTCLSMEIMGYLNPDIAVDVHTLNNTVTEASAYSAIGVFRPGLEKGCEYAFEAAARVASKAYQRYPAKFTSNPSFEISCNYHNNQKASDYMHYLGIPVTAIFECNNRVGNDISSVNSSEALSLAAYYFRNVIYALCRYNLAHFASVN